jgi:uncharacterized DUF497 family protein
MQRLTFEWDIEKNRVNQKKHGVSFEEAKSVFYDDKAIQFWDDDHSEQEDRFLLLGKSYKYLSKINYTYLTPSLPLAPCLLPFFTGKFILHDYLK